MPGLQVYAGLYTKLILIVIEFISILLHSIIPHNLLVLRIMLGLLSFILIPGYLICRVMMNIKSIEELLIFSLLLGFTFQLFLITFFWTFTIEPINLNVVIPAVTLSLVVILLLYLSEKHITLKLDDRSSTFPFVTVLASAMLIRSIYFVVNTSTLGIDGGLYCSFARTIVTEGRFYARVINDIVKGMRTPYYNIMGFTPYPLTIFSIAFFMFVGDSSYASAKIMALFVGLLLVSLIYLFSKEFFGLKAAIVAGLIAAMNPMLSYYSAILHGPEVLGSLFSLVALYLFMKPLRNNISFNECLKYGFLGGVFIAFSFGSHKYTEFIILISVLTLMFIIFNENKLYNFLTALFCFALLFLIAKYRHIPVISLPLTLVAILYIFLLFYMSRKKYHALLAAASLTAILTVWFLDVRSYLIPRVYVEPSMAVFAQNPTQVLNPLSTYYGIRTDLEYIRKTLVRFWDSLQYVSSFIVLLLSFLSLIIPSNRKEKAFLTLIPLISSIIYTLYFPPHVSWYKGYLDIFPDRLLILSSSSLIILSSSIFEDVVKSTCINTRIGKRKIFSALCSLLVIALLLSGLGFYEIAGLPTDITYTEYLDRLKYYDPLESYNWDKAIEWIKRNTPINATILVAEPRRLAWFTDRTTIGIPRDPDGITMEKLANLIKTFNADYVFIDNFFTTQLVVSSNIRNSLCSEDLDEGEMISLLENKKRLEKIINAGNKSYTLKTLGLKLVFSDRDPQTNKITRIYKVVSVKVEYRVLFVDTFDDIENSVKLWIPERKCNLTIRGSNAILTIPTEEANWAYIRSKTATIFNAIENVFFTYKVRGLTPTAKYWTALVDIDNQWHKYRENTKAPVDFTIEVFAVDINKPVKYILLGISGEDYPVIVYDWVALFNYNIIEISNDSVHVKNIPQHYT